MRWFGVWLVCLVAGMGVLGGGGAARAQSDATVVGEIRVVGAQRIEHATIRTYLSFKPGDRVSAADLDKSLKSLFQTGLFADVTLRIDGNAVVINVVENPMINRIAFEGNRRINDETLRGEVQLRPRVVYTRSKVQADARRILDLYRRSGRFGVSVDPKVIQLSQNRVDLVFEIREGSLTEIRSINFIGNRQFGDGRLRGVIQTKESAWYRFLTANDTYDPDRVAFDRELLRRFYLSEGYADFRVISVVAELTPDREAFFITFTVEEGPRYRFGKTSVSTSLKNVDQADLEKLVTVREGDVYNADEVQETVTSLTDAMGDRGFAFVEVRPRVHRDRESRTISIEFDVQEGAKVFVDRINITGNVRTTDEVIRREVLLVPGDAFNASKLRRSRQRITNLGFFEKVDVENVQGDADDQTVVNVDVREKSTGEISFGAGVSNTAGVVGDVQLRERNLVGRGQDLRLRFQLGTEIQQIDLGFTEPYFLDRRIAAGFDLFKLERDLQDESSFNRDSMGLSLRTGYELQDRLFQRWRYTIRQDDITNVSANAALAIREQQGKTLTSEIAHTIQWDKRDNRFDPRDGYLVELTNTYAGLGGDVQLVKNELRMAYHVPVSEDLVVSFRVGGGYVFPIADEVRIIDRFFLGGSNLRGFESAGAGPRDIPSGDALGGDWVYFGTLQTSFPLGLPSEFGIRGRVFSDFGSIGGLEDTSGSVAATGSIRVSAGAGLSWRSPFGPIQIDFARAILKEDFDKTEFIRFNFGTSF